jgi:hypothetical protein
MRRSVSKVDPSSAPPSLPLGPSPFFRLSSTASRNLPQIVQADFLSSQEICPVGKGLRSKSLARKFSFDIC